MPGISFRKIVSFCELLSANLKPLLKDMPHLQDESIQLDTLITRAKSLDNEQQVTVGRLREITRLRRESELEGQDLRSRVAAQLRGKLGFKNETLLGFGIPLRKQSRKAKQTPAPTPPPATTGTPPPTSQKPAVASTDGATQPEVKA
ncbi:MAG TPA: hypothetical protein VIA62_09815 [Thermoanaerobaculia bacterium]|jgi:hypothetical protein|nr:hypothetical protein [Thermoanaerobaculia bacterium]